MLHPRHNRRLYLLSSTPHIHFFSLHYSTLPTTNAFRPSLLTTHTSFFTSYNQTRRFSFFFLHYIFTFVFVRNSFFSVFPFLYYFCHLLPSFSFAILTEPTHLHSLPIQYLLRTPTISTNSNPINQLKSLVTYFLLYHDINLHKFSYRYRQINNYNHIQLLNTSSALFISSRYALRPTLFTKSHHTKSS